MGVFETLVDRNTTFAGAQFDASLKMRPNLATIVIGCLDGRVDPALVLGAEQGDIMAIRNVGGRVTPRTVMELIMLRNVAQAVNSDIGHGWEIIVMQHTQCGIAQIQDRPDLLTPYFEADTESLPELAVGDPRAAVIHDVAALRAEPLLQGVRVSGLVYDVTSGLVDTVVGP
ncbi:carbonic anhydrase [Streptomyces sp. KS_5]|uniref:carbonic anhydrase n=1 Tax=Streptomyces sp. KS_5 TaxID=1881018 RepID=UPI0008954BED|nr:carbonic anhydrase [Streptomyces sp. KS_5]SEE35362.1 carbonic anhydrase [Streptomyces sp. KS_5]